MPNTRRIELARLFDNKTWDTVIVDIPTKTLEDRIEEVAVERAIEEFGGSISLFTIYNTYEDYEDEL